MRRPGPAGGPAIWIPMLLALSTVIPSAGAVHAGAAHPTPIGSGPLSAGRAIAAPSPGSGGPPVYNGTETLHVVAVADSPCSATPDLNDGWIYVTNFGAPPLGGNTISIFSPVNNTSFARIPAGDDPINGIYDPADLDVYVMNYGVTENLTVVRGLTVVGSVPVGQAPRYGVFDPADGYVYIANEVSGNVSIVSGTTIVATVAVGGNPLALTYDPVSQEVYVPNALTDNVSVINGTRLVATVPVQSTPEAAVYDPADGDVYVIDTNSDNVTVVDGTRAIANLSVGSYPEFGAYDPADGDLYVSDTGSSSVHVLKGTAVIANVSVGVYPRGIAFDAANGDMYVAEWTPAEVAVLNGSTLRATVHVGQSPYGATYDPVHGEVDVPNFDSNTVAVLGTPVPSANVTANETGLPLGTAWDLTWGNTTLNASSASITFPTAPGRFPYEVPALDGWQAAVDQGNATVAGGTFSLNVSFEATYEVRFTETGLTPSTNWSVSIPPDRVSSTTSTIEVPEPNGSYSYTFPSVGGYTVPAGGVATVSGRAVTVNVSFVGVPYPVRFEQLGLPSGTPWSVTLGPYHGTSHNASVTIGAPNGSYAFSISAVPGFSALGGNGNVTVRGDPLVIPVLFNETYALAVSAEGLPPGTNWSAAVDGRAAYSTGTAATLFEPNGSYRIALATAATGYAATPATINATIAGFNATGVADFAPIATNASPYEVRFVALDLPVGVTWTVTLFGNVTHGHGSDIAFWEAPGDLPFTASAAGYLAAPGAGVVDLGTSTVDVNVSFSAVAPAVYNVALLPSGLPSALDWNLSVGGAPYPVVGDRALGISLPVGRYAYLIGATPGFRIDRSGSFAVTGPETQVELRFAPDLYVVTVRAVGLPAGTSWTATLIGPAGESSNASATGTLGVAEPNGTYRIVLGPVAGYRAGAIPSVTVSGSDPAVVSVAFSAAPASGTAPVPLLAALGIAAIIVAGLAIVVGLLRRPRAPPEPAEPFPEEAP